MAVINRSFSPTLLRACEVRDLLAEFRDRAYQENDPRKAACFNGHCHDITVTLAERVVDGEIERSKRPLPNV